MEKILRVAIVHDWLVTYAGAERVLEQMLKVFPNADLYSTVEFLDEKSRHFIGDRVVETTFIQRLPFAKKNYRIYLPLMTFAIEQFDMSRYDLVISSSDAVAKGVITGPDQLHICMCYSPIRYAWDLQHQYLQESGLSSGLKGWFAKWILHKIRIWDLRTANGVDEFISISKFIQRRITKVYRRTSKVIYPPVYIDDFNELDSVPGDFYVTASRMVPYKKIDLIVSTFSKLLPDKKLIVIGDGPDFDKIRKLAGPNVQLLGYQEFADLKSYLSRARAFVFAAEEDFGIAPLEAHACGIPVIAYGKGGALETIVSILDDNPTGVMFFEQTEDSLAASVIEFESQCSKITPENCVKNATKFGDFRFREEFKEFIYNKYREWNQLK